MRKITAILLTFIVLLGVLSLCGCGLRKATDTGIAAVTTAKVKENKTEETTEEETTAEETTVPETTAEVTTAEVTTAAPETASIEETTAAKQSDNGESVTEYTPKNTGDDVFDNTLIIGDSRVEGLKLFCDMGNCAIFSKTGLSTIGLYYESVEVPGYGTYTLDSLLQAKKFNKIYLSLGINEIGGDIDVIVQRYDDIVKRILTAQPDTTVVLMANLHIKKSRSDYDEVFQNSRMNALNNGMKGLCNGKNIVFIDPNVLFDDENGALGEDYASDDFHLQVFAYQMWGDWLRDN